VRGRFLVFAGIVLVAFGLRSAATAVSPILLTIEKDIPFDSFTFGLLGTLVPFTFAVIGAIERHGKLLGVDIRLARRNGRC
jgi:CP family cyanate transporter-like MFS transporter